MDFFVRFALLCAVLFQGVTHCRRIPNWQLKIAQSQGPNTCAVEEVPGTNKKYWTECKYWMNREICGVKTVLRYECCEGYHQIAKKEGCTGVKPMTNVLQTARDLGATVFVDFMKDAGLSGRLQKSSEAITLFAPTNEAFEEMTPADQEALKVSLLEGDSPYLLYHVVGGKKLHTKDFHGEQEIETLDGGHKIRINRYSNGMLTVNCAPIVRKDQQATNGLVHLIDQVLIPPVGQSDRPSIPELLFTDGRFRELSRIMLQSNFVNELRRGGPYTLLAPTDEAFQNINPIEVNRMTTDNDARQALMKHHLIPHTICIPAVIDNHKMKTVGGQKLELACNATGVYVDDARLSSEQMIAQNGVISILSKVLVPDRARSVVELMERRAKLLSTFTRLLKKSGLDKQLIEPNVSVTIFAPSNEAFLRMPEEEFTNLNDDGEKLRTLINNHVVLGKIKTESLSDNQRVTTLDRQNTLRLKVYRKEIGIESAIIENSDIEGQNGVLHIIDDVLKPPEQSIMELLEKNEEYSMMADAIHRVQAFEPDLLDNRTGGPFTIFAPTNDAFNELDDHHLNNLKTNKKRLKRMVQNHVVDNMFSARSIHSKLQYDVRTEYQTVKVHKDKDGGLMVNQAHVIQPDVLVTDGIVLCIDRVLMPHGRRKSS